MTYNNIYLIKPMQANSNYFVQLHFIKENHYYTPRKVNQIKLRVKDSSENYLRNALKKESKKKMEN